MSSVDFVLYCAGSGLLLLSAAGAFRLVVSEKQPSPLPSVRPEPEHSPLPADMHLSARMRQFHNQRFASPIVRRQGDLRWGGYAPTPGEPGGRRVVPPIGQLRNLRHPTNRPSSRVLPGSKQPDASKKETSNVIPLPLKQGKPDEPPKKE